jgi:hypothetical protein
VIGNVREHGPRLKRFERRAALSTGVGPRSSNAIHEASQFLEYRPHNAQETSPRSGRYVAICRPAAKNSLSPEGEFASTLSASGARCGRALQRVKIVT